MEKILNKSKSRYFFVGKKKGSKDQGISNSDPPTVSSESRDNRCGPAPSQNSPSSAASPLFHAGDSVMVVHGHHARNSPRSNDAPERLRSQEHTFDSHSATPPAHTSDHLPSSQSRFKVHINPNVFSPIMMPSSTPPRDPSMHSMTTAPPQHRELSSLATSKPSDECRAPSAFKTSNDYRAEHTRTGEVQAHSRSQSALTPDQVLRSHVRMRRQGIPECFMQAPSREMHVQNGHNNSSAERYISDSLKHGPTPTATSNPLLTRPSTSVPVHSDLHNSQNLADLASFRESSTVQAISSHTSLPRSNPRYNLSGFTPTHSAPQPLNRPTEVALGNSSPRHYRAQPSRELDRPRRDTPPPFHPAPHSKLPDIYNRPHTPTRNYHTPNASMSSEKEIGYRGLAFPLPPSNEEGLAMLSSSQSSFSSVASGNIRQGTPTTPRKVQDGQKECDAKTPKSTRSCSTAAGSEKHANADGRASPMLDLETIKKRGRHDVSRNGTDKEGERDTTEKVPERVETEPGSTADVELGNNGLGKEISAAKHHIRATSEDNRGASGRPRALPHPPRPLEPTKPLSFTPGRKTLHTARSFSTGLNERKQLHTSASERDLSSSFHNSVKGERSKKTTAIPVRVVTQRDVSSTSSKPDAQLPTPPNSSTVLSHMGKEQKGLGDSMTLEDVTNALHAQRGRFEELAGYVVEVAQRHAAERAAYAGRVSRLENAIVKMEREIRGLRWLVLEHGKSRKSTAEQPTNAATEATEGGETTDRKLRRSLTMPKFAKLSSPRPTHARSKRDAIGLGLGFSPESVLSSLATLSPPPPEHPPPEVDRTPSMDEIIDKLMGVHQWATDVRVSVVDACETDGEGSKKIVFREP